ncbi:MAG TPA: LysM peptidoglycan-binding domain-containing protein [Mobilitalea sp.]|nr:LysM peptidoglycan-binding domain-containing protein [Mobilitalea sp.]
MNRTMNSLNDNNVIMYRRRMWIIGSLLLIFLVLFSLYFFSKTVTAQRDGERTKLVTSVEVKKGDTLWSIASNFISYEYDDMNDYIDELIDSNGLATDTIHAGNYIIVPYYADASR